MLHKEMKDYLIMLEERYHLNCAFDCIPTQINKGNYKGSPC